MKRYRVKPAAEEMTAEDAALLARLQAMPQPGWMAAVPAADARARAFEREWKAILNADPISVEDAELLARLQALPDAPWLAPMLAYKSHDQRMREWFRELDKARKPMTWHPIEPEHARYLANYCLDCAAVARTEATMRGHVYDYNPEKPCTRKGHDALWSEKRRAEVLATVRARGDMVLGAVPASAAA